MKKRKEFVKFPWEKESLELTEENTVLFTPQELLKLGLLYPNKLRSESGQLKSFSELDPEIQKLFSDNDLKDIYEDLKKNEDNKIT